MLRTVRTAMMGGARHYAGGGMLPRCALLMRSSSTVSSSSRRASHVGKCQSASPVLSLSRLSLRQTWRQKAVTDQMSCMTFVTWQSCPRDGPSRFCCSSSSAATHQRRGMSTTSSSRGQKEAVKPAAPSAASESEASEHKQRHRLGIGGSKLAHVNPSQHASVIVTSLQNGVTTFESGHGGQDALSKAFMAAVAQMEQQQIPVPNDITLTARFGYRTVVPSDDDNDDDDDDDQDQKQEELQDADGGQDKEATVTTTKRFEGDVPVQPPSIKGTNETALATGEDKAQEESIPHKDTTESNGKGEGTETIDIAAQPPHDDEEDKKDNNNNKAQRQEIAMHNIGAEYASFCLSHSPLVNMRRAFMEEEQHPQQQHHPSKCNINSIYMAHNPEVQGAYLSSRGAPVDQIREFVKEQLTDGFVALECGVADNIISSYGVCSNGLSLPPSHPLHLPWKDVLQAASDAARIVHGMSISKQAQKQQKENKGTKADEKREREGEENMDNGDTTNFVANLSTLQLPANLLETSGFGVARDVREYLRRISSIKQAVSAKEREDDEEEKTNKEQQLNNDDNDVIPFLPSDLDIYITRPLTCYPDRGMGTGHPFKLVDYKIPVLTTPDDDDDDDLSTELQWTHLISSSKPPGYDQALNAAMRHFDATHILEEGEKRKLTVEERETLDGCKLLRSMIHDLDNGLETIRSFAAYEDELYTKVVPLIHDTFEGLDEESASVLQSFFAAHGSAVRHAIARTTRQLLKEGGEGVPPYDVPDDMTLHEYALQHVLREKAVSKVIVGCPQPDHVLEAIRAADAWEKTLAEEEKAARDTSSVSNSEKTEKSTKKEKSTEENSEERKEKS